MLKFGGEAALVWHRPRSGRSTLAAADSTDPVIDYGVAAGAGDGEQKLKFTAGAFSAPACELNGGRGAKPSIPAMSTVGNRLTMVL